MTGETYSAFGLTIHSELPLPGLRRATGDPDITIRRGEVKAPSGFPASGIAHEADADADRFAWLDLARLRITNSEITVDTTDDAYARQCVVGPGLGVIMHRRGLLVLHGAALDVKGKALVLLGEKGAGKSTTAAALIARGHRLLTDDLVVIGAGIEGNPTVLPGPTQMKLWPESVATIGLDASLTPFVDGHDKGLWFGAPTSSEAVPLGCIGALSWGESLIESVAGAAAFGTVFEHVYAPRFLGAAAGTALVGPLGKLASEVLVTRLSRPRSLDEIDAFVTSLESRLG